MKILVIATLFAFPITSLATTATINQGNTNDPGSDNSAYESGGAAQDTAPAPGAESKYSGSISYTGIFTYESINQGILNGTSQKMAGWGITPELNFTKHIGLQGDFVTTYADTHPSITQFTIAAGPRYTLNPFWKGTPFFFGEAGETRVALGTYGGLYHPGTTWEPTASAGIGFDFNLTPRFGLQFVPGEWMGQRFDYNGSWQNSYMARFGIVFNFRRK